MSRRGFRMSPVVCGATSRRKTTEKPPPLAEPEYWEGLLEKLEMPTPIKLRDNVNMEYAYGIEPKVNLSRSVPCYEFYMEVKKKYPKSIVIVQVGSFYETVGIDAILLVEYLGIAAMGGEMRAGFPLMHIKHHLSTLLKQDPTLEMVVCQELADEGPTRLGEKSKDPKNRQVVGVVNRANPNFDYGLLENDLGSSTQFEDSYALVALERTPSGFTMYEVNVEQRSITRSDNLSKEAVDARIERGGICHPIYLHESVYVPASELVSNIRTEEQLHVYRMRPAWNDMVGGMELFRGGNALQKLKLLICKRYGWDTDEADKFYESTTAKQDRPRPLYPSTARQVGLDSRPGTGVPSLLDCVLPRQDTCQMVRRWMEKHLLSPPPPPVALSVREAARILLQTDAAFPNFPVIPPNRIAKLINEQEVPSDMFRNLSAVCDAVITVFETESTERFGSEMLMPTSIMAAVKVKRGPLTEGCEEARKAIDETVVSIGGQEQPTEVLWEEGMFEEKVVETILEFVDTTERGIRGHVRQELIESELCEVERAAQRVVDELKYAISSLETIGCAAGVDHKNQKIMVQGDLVLQYSEALRRAVAKNTDGPKFVNPVKDNGNERKTMWVSEELKDAREEYFLACSRARHAITAHLKALARTLQGPMQQHLCVASWFCIGCEAMRKHVMEAKRRGWALPVLNLGAEHGSHSGQRGALHIQDCWPFWMEGNDSATVRNSVELQSMILLTGPNMAGKSTILRQVAVCALLGSCGLMAPCSSASIPYIDSFLLRTFSQDSPQDGVSSYGVECRDMAIAQKDTTRDTLLLVDELGKGTEVQSGIAMAGAMLEELDAIGCRGIFATHLHGLFDLDPPLNVSNLKYMKMGTTEIDPDDMKPEYSAVADAVPLQKPTWKMEDGKCRDSLALRVALDHGIQIKTVKRANEILKRLQELESSRQIPGSCKASVRSGDAQPVAVDAAARPEPSPATRATQDALAGVSSTPPAAATPAPPQAPHGGHDEPPSELLQGPGARGTANRQAEKEGAVGRVPARPTSPTPGGGGPRGAALGTPFHQLFPSQTPPAAAMCLERFKQGETVNNIAMTSGLGQDDTVLGHIACGIAARSNDPTFHQLEWDNFWRPLFLQTGRHHTVISATAKALNELAATGSLHHAMELDGVSPEVVQVVAAWLLSGSPSPQQSSPTHAGRPAPPQPPPTGVSTAQWPSAQMTGAASTAQHSLQQATKQLQDVFEPFRARLGDYDIISVEPGTSPPPKHAMTACIYICRWDSGLFKVGETDRIEGRLNEHRTQDKGGLTRNRGMRAIYVPVPNKSLARELESLLQRRLIAENFLLWEESDSRNRNFGRSK